MSGKCIRSWTAGWTAVARGQEYSTLSNGRGSTTLPMQQVGNCPTTSRMHPTWSRHSTRPIQQNQPPKFIKWGPLSYMSLCIFIQLIDYSLYRFFLEPQFPVFCRIRSSYLQVRPLSFHPPRHLPHRKLHFRLPS